MVLYYLLALAACLVVAAAGFFTRKAPEKVRRVLMTATAALLGLLFFFRDLGGRPLLNDTIGLNITSPFGPQGSVSALFATFALWLTVAAMLALVTYPFFAKSISVLRPLVLFFAIPIYLYAFATLSLGVVAMDGAERAAAFYYRDILYALEIGVALGFGVMISFSPRPEGLTRAAWWRVVLAALGFAASAMPVYLFRVLFGNAPAHLTFKDMTPEHRIMIYGMIVVPVIIHFLLHKLNYEQKRYALIILSLGTMIAYSYNFILTDFFSLREWPLHICNTAMYIVPLCLITKSEKIYYFTLFINVLGALFAMLMPDTTDGMNIFAPASVEFWLNHYCAFFMPLLIMSLRIFRRPKFKQFLYATVAFTIYFLLVLTVNAWYGDTDFFFLNSNFIADKLGEWAESLRATTAEVHLFGRTMVFYPSYQIPFYLTYVLLSLAVWFVYEQLFEISDLYTEITGRNKKIKADRLALEVALGGRSIKEPVNMEGTNKLILRDFSKKYSTSDVYAVKGANLEVEGGQIFGFLGPNGAGKSTIIKSVVGIQTITSGAIEVCGYDVEKQSVEAKRQIGFVPDHYALYENLTGREYINYIADLYGVSEEDRTARINEYVERFHLQGSFENQMKTYSHGMKQKITIMSALVHDPKLWILDEPLTGLDPESIFQVKECMKAHAAKGNIVFFSSHIIDVVERICDRIAIIKKGNILYTGTLAEIEASGEPLEHLYMRMTDQLPIAEAEARAEKRHADA